MLAVAGVGFLELAGSQQFVIGRVLRVAGCGLRVAGCGLRVAGCGLREERSECPQKRSGPLARGVLGVGALERGAYLGMEVVLLPPPETSRNQVLVKQPWVCMLHFNRSHDWVSRSIF